MIPLLGYGDVWLIGGGGKTTLMYRLAAAWARRGEATICTTTTRILPPTPEQGPDLRVGDVAAVLADLRRRPSPLVTVVSGVDDGKCRGFAAPEALSLRAAADHLVVEADGAAGRPMKAHAPHEPVIAAGAACVVAVVGAWCVGTTLDAAHVHRAERFAALSGLPLGSVLTAADVARVILHEAGWLRAVPAGAALHVVVTGHEPSLVRAIASHPRVGCLTGLHEA